MARSLVTVALLTSLSAGCSWSRFDDVTEKGPIEFLKKPDNFQTGFGGVLTTGRAGERPRLVVGGEHGTSPAALFDPSNVDQPNLAALDSRLCPKVAKACFLSPQVAHVPSTTHGSPPLDARDCVALGIGRANLEGDGVLFECLDGSSFSRPVLDLRRYADDVEFALDNQQEEPVATATDGSENPPVLVGAPTHSLAWYYEPSSDEPVALLPPVPIKELPPGFGTRVTALRLGDGDWLFAVNAQGGGELHLFRARGASPRYLGCLGGTPDFGRTLASGLVPGPDTPEIGDDVPDLVVADRGTVFVFDGAKLADLPAVPAGSQDGYTCTLAALPEGALLSSFGCGSTPDTSECSSSDFGAALALGDIDGDGDNEVIVGAPQMTVRGEHGAGAVLLYDVDHLGDGVLQDVRFLAQGEQGDALGGAVAAIPAENRDILVASAVRSGKVGLFYCSSMVPGAKRGKRCE
jgi:hypothetical protein